MKEMTMRMISVLFCSIILISGCTTLLAPGSDLIDQTMVAQLGDTEPAEKGSYILHIPAGQRVPIRILIDGTMFRNDENIEAEVSLAHDLYLYKYWASYDGKNWKKWNDLVKIGVSSGMGTKGAELNATIDDAGRK